MQWRPTGSRNFCRKVQMHKSLYNIFGKQYGKKTYYSRKILEWATQTFFFSLFTHIRPYFNISINQFLTIHAWNVNKKWVYTLFKNTNQTSKIWNDFNVTPKVEVTILGIVYKYVILDFRDHIEYKIIIFTKLHFNNITVQSYFIYCLPYKTKPSFILLICMEVDRF